MKKLLPLLLVLVAAAFYQFGERSSSSTMTTTDAGHEVASAGIGSDTLSAAYEARAADVPVEGEGEVIKLLADDNDGSRHQRFLVRVSPQQTILIAHNIDLAPRVENLRAGDSVSFRGEYAWNPQGGVVHWTHRDPRGRHADGWIEHDGRRVQ